MYRSGLFHILLHTLKKQLLIFEIILQPIKEKDSQNGLRHFAVHGTK